MLIYAQIDSSAVVDHLRTTFTSERVRTFCTYCNYLDCTRQTPVNLIASLLKQLIQDGHPISESLGQIYRTHSARSTRPDLEEISSAFRSELRGLERVSVVLDALDECDEANGFRGSLLAELRTFPGINLMVTSRPHVGLEDPLSDIERVVIRACDDDLFRYMDGRISRDARLAKHVKEHLGLREDTRKTIVEAARGMYVASICWVD